MAAKKPPTLPTGLMDYDPAYREILHCLELAEKSETPADVLDSIKRIKENTELRAMFTDDVTTPQSATCREIEVGTRAADFEKVRAEGKVKRHLKARWLTGHMEGMFLKMITSIHKAKRVLDIGMFTGYSALCMAEALPPDGECLTVDIEPWLEKFTGDLLKSSPHADKIKIVIGNGTEYMEQLIKEGKQVDVAFLDGSKDIVYQLQLFFEQGLLAPNGTVCIDNPYYYGSSYIPPVKEDNYSKIFTDYCKSNPNLHQIIVPIRDGVLVVRRTCDVERLEN